MSGVALLDKARGPRSEPARTRPTRCWSPAVGLAMVVLVPLVWGVIRRTQGMPMFGSPTVAELEDPSYRPGIVGMKRGDAAPESPLDRRR